MVGDGGAIVGDGGLVALQVGHRRGDGAGDQIKVGGALCPPIELILGVRVVAVGAVRLPFAILSVWFVLMGVGQHFAVLGIAAVVAAQAQDIDFDFVVSERRDWRILPPNRVAVA